MSRLARAVLGTAITLALAWTSATAAQAGPGPGPGPGKPRTERVSTATDGSQAGGESMSAAISADGRQVAFTSTAPSFGCTHFSRCLLVKDLSTGEVTRIDLGSGHTYGYPMPSADGSRIAFSAGTRFMAPYLYDRTTGRSQRLWPENPPGFNELGRVQSISPDGTHVAYTIGNRNGSENFRLLYVRDTATGTDELSSPAEEGDKAGASVSGDGERVAYGVRVDSETDPVDVFVKNRATGERTQVDTGLGVAYLVRITADGRRVLLNAESGVYLHDLRTGESRRVAEGTAFSATSDGRYAVVAGEDGVRVRDLRTGLRGAALPPAAQPGDEMLAAKGRAVVFSSTASHLVPGDTNGEFDVFVFSGALRKNPEPMPSVTERISTTPHGQQRTGASYDPVMGEDKVVTFTSQGTDDPKDTNVFVHAAGGIAQVNSTAQGPSQEGTPCSSGRMVGYAAPLDSDGGPGIHIRNRAVGKLTGLGSYQGVRFTWMGQPGVDPTCQWITYAATLPATDADPHPQPRVYRYRSHNGATDVVSAPTGEAAGNPAINYDGRYIAFEQGDDLYVRDLDNGALEKAGDSASAPSLSADGRKVAFRNDLPARHPSANADGTVVAFESASPDLVEADTNGVSDVFLRTVQ